MKPSILRRLTIVAAATATTLTSMAAIGPAFAATFGQKEVDQSKFVAIASPNAAGDFHQLLVLEQISTARECWDEYGSAPVKVDPLLLDFDFTGICGRSTDSNGYSIRMAGQDLATQYNLRVLKRDNDLVLVGAPSFNNPSGETIEIGHTNGFTTDFAKIQLNEGWRFTKRTYGDRTLGHIYLTYDGSAPGTGTPGGGTDPSNPSFRDINNDIYKNEIEEAVKMGFIAGFSEDNTFRPQASLTREQIVSMALEGLDKLPDINLQIPSQASGNPYRDVEAGRWSAAKIQFARDNNIVSGYSDGTFRPAQAVTRAELMAILRRAAEFAKTEQGKSPVLQAKQEEFAFTDIGSHWASPLVRQMSSYCQVASPLNETGNAFYPDQAARRNYAAAATLRMLNCVKDDAS